MRALLALLTVSLAAGISTAAQATPTSAPGFLGCKGFTAPHSKPAVRPKSIIVACGDANFYFTGLKWSSWTTKSAAGRGTAHQNDCTPSCAAGHFHSYAAGVRLSLIRSCHGHRVFWKITWLIANAKPKGVLRSGSQTFGCA